MTIKVFSQTPPSISVGTASISAGTYSVPITVAGFVNAGNISLKLIYDETQLDYAGVTLNTGLIPSNTLVSPVSDQSGIFRFSYSSSSAIVLGTPVNTLFIINFTAEPGIQGVIAPLTWSTIQGDCDITPPVPEVYIPPITAANMSDYFINGSINILPDLLTLNLNLHLEGLYTGGGIMNQAKGTSGNQYPGNTADVISVELRDPVAFTTLVYAANSINLSNLGLATLEVPSLYTGSYYITVRHRNSVATVSAIPVSFASATINYNFTSQITQAFGNNMRSISAVFVFYAGDTNQDGIVDLGDLIPVGNEASQAGSGYIPEDVTGDGLVDLSDLIMVGNNASQAVGAITP